MKEKCERERDDDVQSVVSECTNKLDLIDLVCVLCFVCACVFWCRRWPKLFVTKPRRTSRMTLKCEEEKWIWLALKHSTGQRQTSQKLYSGSISCWGFVFSRGGEGLFDHVMGAAL